MVLKLLGIEKVINIIVPKLLMGFIRIKKINGAEYAYLVENKWYKRGFKSRGKGSRQTVSKYLGRVYSFDKANDVKFFDFKVMSNAEQYLVDNTQEEVIKDLVRWELYRHNINDFSIDFNSKKITKNKKNITIRMNEGFLCSYTLRRLFNLRKEDSLYLAKCFVDAGIEVPKEVFVGLFSED